MRRDGRVRNRWWPRLGVAAAAMAVAVGAAPLNAAAAGGGAAGPPAAAGHPLPAQEPPSQAGPRRPLAIDDMFAIGRVAAPVLDPQGRQVAYTVTRTDLEEERNITQLWLVALDGGDPLPMTRARGAVSAPRFSPDGRYLSFLAARDEGKTQVWILDRRGGEAQQLTDVKQGVQGYAWSPDGGRLVLEIRDPEPDADPAWKSKSPKPWVIDRLQFKRDYVGYLTGDRHTHLYVFDLASRSLTQITSGRYDESQPAWSPDGRRIAFVSNRTEEPDGNSNTDVWVVDADNTDQGRTLLRVSSSPGADGSPAWSPDGRWIAHTTVLEPDLIWYATTHLAVSAADGGGTRVLTRALDRNVSTPRFSANGKRIWFALEDSGATHLASVGLDGAALERTIAGALSVRGWEIGRAGQVVAAVSTPARPAEVFRVGDAGELVRLSHVNDELLAGVRLGEVEKIRFPSADGTEIEAFVVKPPGFEEGFRYPTILWIHGGPVSQYEAAFNFQAQLFAANGYLVLLVNPRGSSGYGQEFSAALWADWGGVDFQDVMAGVDELIARGWADPDRLGVGGWSYGGILTDHVITKTDRFKAAISGASEVLYVANYGHDHYQLQWEKELGLPWVPENRARWERISPFNYVDRVRTPTLIMGGEEDWNVPIQNSEQLYQALRRLGVPTQLVVYPGQHHGLSVPAYQKDRLERYLAWFGRWLGPSPGARPAASSR